VLCVSAVKYLRKIHRRGAEDAEGAQRNVETRAPLVFGFEFSVFRKCFFVEAEN
jgi:hypothetical protein